MKKLTRKQVIKIGKAFLKKNNIKYSVILKKNNDDNGGSVWPDKNKIEIQYNKKTDSAWIASAFLHEFYHIYCYRNSIYPAYHAAKGFCNYNSIKYLNAVIKTGLKERFVDKLAQNEFKKIFPCFRYVKSYHTLDHIKYLNDVCLSWYKGRKKHLEELEAWKNS